MCTLKKQNTDEQRVQCSCLEVAREGAGETEQSLVVICISTPSHKYMHIYICNSHMLYREKKHSYHQYEVLPLLSLEG